MPLLHVHVQQQMASRMRCSTFLERILYRRLITARLGKPYLKAPEHVNDFYRDYNLKAPEHVNGFDHAWHSASMAHSAEPPITGAATHLDDSYAFALSCALTHVWCHLIR